MSMQEGLAPQHTPRAPQGSLLVPATHGSLPSLFVKPPNSTRPRHGLLRVVRGRAVASRSNGC